MTGLFSLDLFTVFAFFNPFRSWLVLFGLLLRSFFQHPAFVSFQKSVTFQGKRGTRAWISPSQWENSFS